MSDSAILRVYDPSECDASGMPLDWECCRRCGGTSAGETHEGPVALGACKPCGGHGSLKAAALARLAQNQMWAEVERQGAVRWPSGGASVLEVGDLRRAVEAALIVRCEDCGHPMSEGTWEPRSPDWEPRDGLLDPVGSEAWAMAHMRHGADPPRELLGSAAGTHYSPCDEGCTHGGPGREWFEVAVGADPWAPTEDVSKVAVSYPREASWRPVDVRPLGWAHDLRPERLSILCLRCFAARPTGAVDV